MAPPDDLPGSGDADRAWAAPEAPPIEDAGPVVPAPATVIDPAAGADRAAPGGDPAIRLPVPLRPMTMGDLLDGGFNVLRAEVRTVLALAAVFVVPVQLLVAYLNRDALDDLEQLIEQSFAGSGTSATTTVGSTWGSLISAVGSSLGQTLVAGGLAVMVVAWYGGTRPGLADILRTLRGRIPALSVAWLFVHLLELVGALALGVGTLVAMTFYLVTAPAIAVERLGPFAGMGRSSRLASRRFWFVLGFALLSGLVATTLGQVLGLLPQLLGLLLGPDIGWVALGVGAIITQLVATTVVGASTTLLYLDLRIRQEGFDLAWGADEHLPQ